MAAKVVTFRLETDLLARLDAHAARLTEASPGLNVTRSDALRVLVLRALAEEEAKVDASAAKRRR